MSGTPDGSFPLGFEEEYNDYPIVKFKQDIGSKGYMIEFQNNSLQLIQDLGRMMLQYDVSDKTKNCGCRN